jgi:DNA-binding transcriptional LysR family regulator
MTMDLDALRAFGSFAAHLNFTRAAVDLNISQPALHVKIRKLGEVLGIALYERHGRELRLTAAGKRVAAFAHDTSATVSEFVASLQGESAIDPVVLAAGEGSLLYLLPAAIRGFTSAASTPLKVLTRDREGMLEAVRRGQAHVGVGTLDVVPEDLAVVRLVRAEQIAALPKGHRLAKKRQLRPRDLDGEALIVPPAGRPHRELIARVLLDAGASWTVAVEANGWPVMLELARSGAGIAIVNSTCRLPAGLVARRLLGFPATHYHLVHRRGRLADPVRDLVARIRSSASAS